jgi:hypothetical protein
MRTSTAPHAGSLDAPRTQRPFECCIAVARVHGVLQCRHHHPHLRHYHSTSSRPRSLGVRAGVGVESKPNAYNSRAMVILQN